MEPVRGLPGIVGGTRVHERAAGGNKGDGEAFRRALQQGASDSGKTGAREEAPMRARLQSRPDVGRKDDGPTARHVDVIA
jgi:hypothetical protein